MKKSGFTLSEVLMTLTIIGVVSAMTVPSLITSIEDRELQAQAKKAYNTLQNAINMKYTLTKETPADVKNTELFSVLLAGDSAPTIKYNVKYGNVVQLPDGQIMTSGNATNGGNNCGTVGTTEGFCRVMVDVNGEDGPNFSYAGSENYKEGATTKLYPLSYIGYSKKGDGSYDRAYRDLVYFTVQDLTVKPLLVHGVTKRYFTGQK